MGNKLNQSTKMEQYKCMKCELEFDGPAGPNRCPVCNHEYVHWVSFEFWHTNPMTGHWEKRDYKRED